MMLSISPVPSSNECPFKIGLSANLTNGRNVHRQTFLNAVSLFQVMHQLDPQFIELHYECDDGNAEGGLRAAEALTEWGADVVIGHFVSDAADAARAVYVEADIPLLLPAAGTEVLVEPGRHVFRLCDSDHRLAQALTADLAIAHDVRSIAVACDDSLYGVALSTAIVQAARKNGQHVERISSTVQELDVASDACIFVGSFDESVRFLQHQYATGLGPKLVLTGSAVAPELAAAMRAFPNPILLYGLRPASAYQSAHEVLLAHVRRFGYTPGMYFLETYAALEIVWQYLMLQTAERSLYESLLIDTWETVLGTVRFTGNEGGAHRYGQWLLQDGQLQYCKALPATPKITNGS